MSDTGWVSPSTVVSDDLPGGEAWSNPSNATSSDNSYAVVTFDIDQPSDGVVYIVKDGVLVEGEELYLESLVPSTDTYKTVGDSDELWGETWSASDINDSGFGTAYAADTTLQFSEFLKATNFGFDIPTGATIDGIEVRVERKYTQEGGSDDPPSPPTHVLVNVDHIQIKVYYTESGDTPTVGVKYPLPAFKNVSEEGLPAPI